MSAKLDLSWLGTQVSLSKTWWLLLFTSKPSVKSPIVAISMIGLVFFGFSWPIVIWKLPENKQEKVTSYITVACVLFCREDPRIQTKQNDWDVTKYTSQNNNIIEIGWWHLNNPAKRKKKIYCARGWLSAGRQKEGQVVALPGMSIYL